MMTAWNLDDSTSETASIGNERVPSVPTTVPVEAQAPAPAPVIDDAIRGASSVDNALSSADRIYRSLLVAADLMRDEREAEATRQFTRCLEGLERFVETIRFIRIALRLDFERLEVEGRSFARIELELSRILQSMSNHVALSDWEAVADRIEYELLTNLCSWKSALKRITPAA